MHNMTFITIAGFACSLIAGCSLFGPEKNLFGDDRVTSASANQIFYKEFEGFDEKHLLQLLDPDSYSVGSHGEQKQKPKTMVEAFRRANAYEVAHRSQVQDRLIAASNQRCNLYMTYLKRVNTYTNGIFGILTTALGGAGAIVTGQDTSRLLSGLAGISSGSRAELNQAIFESIATSVIIPGIRKSRAELLKTIENKRYNSLAQYTVEGAIADAIAYHGKCSMDTGIDYAQKSIQFYGDVGIKRFTAIQTQLGIARSASGSLTLGPLSSLIVAENVLDAFSGKLNEYKSRIDPQNAALAKLLSDTANAITKDGALRKEAIALDSKLKEVMFNYASAVGSEKSDLFSILEAQQIEATKFSWKVEAKNSGLLVKLNRIYR